VPTGRHELIARAQHVGVVVEEHHPGHLDAVNVVLQMGRIILPSLQLAVWPLVEKMQTTRMGRLAPLVDRWKDPLQAQIRVSLVMQRRSRRCAPEASRRVAGGRGVAVLRVSDTR